MSFDIPMMISASKQWLAQDGKRMVTIQGLLVGISVFKMTIPENLIPDDLEGGECVGVFEIGVDSNFKPTLRLKSISCK